jgi:hypothetical protein
MPEHRKLGRTTLFERMSSLARGETAAKRGAEMRPAGTTGETRRPAVTETRTELPPRGPGIRGGNGR